MMTRRQANKLARSLEAEGCTEVYVYAYQGSFHVHFEDRYGEGYYITVESKQYYR